jgi:nucleoside-diphosphate-sugar epimerase
LEKTGARALVADLAESGWHTRMTGSFDFVLNCVGSGGGGPGDYRRSYVDGMRSIADWLARQAGPKPVFVYTSSTSVYPKSAAGEVTEATAPASDSPSTAALLEAEEMVRHEVVSCCARWHVLRLAGIYGPGRHRLLDLVRAGEWHGPPDPGRWINLVHRDDVVRAIMACFEADGAPGGIYNVSDGSPAMRGEILAWLAQRLGRPVPALPPAGGVGAVRRIDSTRLRRELGWKPRHPDFRSGYEEILRNG